MSGLSVKVNSRNQITIPKSVREKLNIKMGDQLVVDVQKKMLVIKPQKRQGSPLAVEGIKKKLSRREILESIEEGRKV
jgi:AbrB family looped-hinge helix DNA binding protein